MKKHLGEWLCIAGIVVIAVQLYLKLGFADAIMYGAGLALIVGGIVRTIKTLHN